ncbi:MAG: class I SAM-dependent methyltransferase [Bacteroidetes bacterium]|nr:class I SAM-dependent methyltransferase [Bacteroidota bacterium]
MGERTFDDFDGFAGDYRNIHTQNIKMSGADSFYFAEMKVKLLLPFEKDEPLQVLDVGCGDGATELFMQEYFSRWNVKGIDVSANSIEKAKARDELQASFEVYDGSHIPVENDSQDIVFMAGVLHHVSFDLHDGLLQEICRVLKKGGRLYVFEHNPLNPVTKHLVNTCVFDKDAKLLGNGYTKKLLQRNGFTIKNNRFIIFFPRKGMLSKLIFMERAMQWLPLGGQYFLQVQK